MSTTPTPAEQAAAFADAVRRAGIRADFGDLDETAQTEYWASQAQAIMGPDWDGQDADVEKFAESLELSPGRTVTHTLDAAADSDAFLYYGDMTYGSANEYVNWYEADDPSRIVTYPLYPAPSTDRFDSTVWANRVFRADSRTFTIGATSVQVQVELGVQERENVAMDIMEFHVHVHIWPPDGGHEVKKTWCSHVSYNGVDRWSFQKLGRDDYPIYSPFYPCVMEFGFWGKGQALMWRARAEVHCGDPNCWAGNTHHIVHPARPAPGRFYLLRGLDFLPKTGQPQSVRFTMPGGGGGGGGGGTVEPPQPRPTLQFTARAGASGTHGDPYTGVFAVPAPRTEVPTYGSGGYGGHGGGGGAGGATTIIRRFTSDKAEAIEQIAQTHPHGYASPGGQATKGGDGCILIFW